MRVLGLTAAGLLAGVVVVVATASGGTATRDTEKHTCSATDRQFIREAKINMVAVGHSGREYLIGDGQAKDVIEDTRRAASLVYRTRPTDPALDKARILMATMFREYGNAIKERSRNRAAGPHMYRAYGLANFARDILTVAAPQLRERGCDVAGLL